jgi:hypothetical protein
MSGALTIVEAPAAVTVTADAASHTVGAWAQLIAVTTTTTDFLTLNISGAMSGSNVDTRGLLDIGIGAAASEVAVVTSIPVGFLANGMSITIPLRVPKGSRLAARLQALIVSDTIGISAVTQSTTLPVRSPSTLVTLNADTAASTSTTFATVSDTWTEVTAATTQPFRGLVAAMCGGVGNSWFVDNNEVLSIGTGAAGAETLAARSNFITWTSTEAIQTTATYGYPPTTSLMSSSPVPKGTRVVMKYNTGRSYKGAIVFGVPYA